MPVFKLCLKVYKKNMRLMSIYFGVFILLSAIMMTSISSGASGDFSQVKAPVAVLTEDESPLIEGLLKSLEKNAYFVSLKDDPNTLQDALYFRQVEYIIRIPKGFSQAFLSGDTTPLEVVSLPGSTSKVYLDMALNQYLNTVKRYAQVVPNQDLQATVKQVLTDLEITVEVEVTTKANKLLEGANTAPSQNLIKYVFNYLAYTLMFVLILGVSTIMLVFNKEDIKKRNNCSPIATGRISFELLMANAVFATVTWVILIAFTLLFTSREAAHLNTLYYVLNSIVFTLCVSSISFLIGNLAKSKEAINAIATVFTLGTCFLSGVFVPQFILGKAVLKAASFLPTYWYVAANDKIATLTSFDWPSLSPVMGYMAIELAFGLAFFILALVMGKRKQMQY